VLRFISYRDFGLYGYGKEDIMFNNYIDNGLNGSKITSWKLGMIVVIRNKDYRGYEL
jgi:hypothetical protein